MEVLLAFRSFSTFYSCSTSFGQGERWPVSASVVPTFARAYAFSIFLLLEQNYGQRYAL